MKSNFAFDLSDHQYKIQIIENEDWFVRHVICEQKENKKLPKDKLLSSICWENQFAIEHKKILRQKSNSEVEYEAVVNETIRKTTYYW